MEQSTEPLVVGVRFSKVGKIYHFVADTVTDIKVGDMVVVETSRGWQLGQVAQIVPEPEPPPEGWKAIDRRATPRDLLLRQMWQMKESEVVSNCRSRASDLRLSGIKIVSAEYSFDGSRLTILFSSETEEKYDLKSLRSDMQKMFAPSQVEMRQVGPRDVAKVMCGMGACGLETRCCCLFLTEFSSISIRMAKEQGISLTPTEITGMCGRLRCCLIYEYDNYVDARSKLPKRNKRVRTPQGEGKVVDVIPLRGAVLVDVPEQGVREYPGSDIIVLDADGNPLPDQPQQTAIEYHGTQQASEIDKAITGDETVKPFEISSENPPPASPWENPPTEEQPRSMPHAGRQPRQGGPQRGGQGGSRPQGGGPQGGEAQQGNRPPQERRDRGSQRGGGGPAPRDRGPRREGRPQGSQQPNRGQGTPPGGPGKPENQQGGGPSRPRNERGGSSNNPPPAGGTPGNQGNRPPSGGASNRGRDQRRRKGRRRDSNDSENPA